jgi:hypothetical protein
LAKLVKILCQGSLGPREWRLGRVLDFFGVPWEAIDSSTLRDLQTCSGQYVVFGPVSLVAAALDQSLWRSGRGYETDVFYAYADEERDSSARALASLFPHSSLSLVNGPAGSLLARISAELSEITGLMAGLELSVRLTTEDAVLIGLETAERKEYSIIISAGDGSVFIQFERNNASVFFCTSSYMVDLDQPVAGRSYDVKDHFCSVVSLVLFIKSMFAEVVWQPQELSACVIIDDPLLRPQYGFCNFASLRDLMRKHRFTTSIAFIPWNWRRTNLKDAELFRNEQALFSVSIHGCDHTAGEFGATSPEILDTTAKLALSRMRGHEKRSGIQHDLVMVFPQGVFSSTCPRFLKSNGFLAAVNTETIPVDQKNAKTRIGDVWDVAIMAYDEFPIFTRRYPVHGIENFAFDLLLGKPCLIVVHHDFFRDGGDGLARFIDQIHSLNCRVHWRRLSEIVRRACRCRSNGADKEFQMYGNELVISNPTDRGFEATIQKRKGTGDPFFKILCDEQPIAWTDQDDHYVLKARTPSRSEKRIRVVYREEPNGKKAHRSFRYEISVAARRVLSELRDDYLAKSPILTLTSEKFARVIRKAL